MVELYNMVYIPGKDEAGKEDPEWFSYPKVVKFLREQNPLPCDKGFTVFMIGYQSRGKDQIARALQTTINQGGCCPISMLIGETVRSELSTEPGFSR